MNQIGNMHLIGCGGAGTNIATAVFREVSKNNKKYSMANVSLDLMDTTVKNVHSKHKIFEQMFTKIGEHDGLGSEKRSMDQAVALADVKDWLGKQKSPSSNDYYIIITSASGASGSTITPLLTSQLLENGYNAIVIMVGDTSNLLYTRNSIDTINVMHRTAKRYDKALSTMFYMNNTAGTTTTPESEVLVNSNIVKFMSVFGAFLSGKIYNLDNEDMSKFIDPKKYSTIKTDSGLYTLGVGTEESLPKDVLLCRILSYEGNDANIDSVVLHSKVGLGDENHRALLGDKDVYLYSRNNVISGILKELKTIESNYDALGVIDSSEFDENSDDDIFF